MKATTEFTISDHKLILTFPPESLNVCKHCSDLHVLVLEVGTPENIRQLALGLLHLVEHVDGDR